MLTISQDEHRLPEGFERVGYDADSQQYTFLERSTGKYYESAPGNRYGALRPVKTSTGPEHAHGNAASEAAKYDDPAAADDIVDPTENSEVRAFLGYPPSYEEIERNNQAIEKDNKEAMRIMLPFALLVLIFLFLVFKFLYGGADDAVPQVQCGEGYHEIQIKKGETCWSVGKAHGMGVEDLLNLEGNEDVDCDRLEIGQGICVPAYT